MHLGFWLEIQKERFHQEDNMKMDLREIECGGMDWIFMDQWRALMNTVMKL
jgi:hypothetical protein